MPGNTIQQTAAATAGVGEPSGNAALTCHFELPGAQDVMPTDEKDATDASDVRSESPEAEAERDEADVDADDRAERVVVCTTSDDEEESHRSSKRTKTTTGAGKVNKADVHDPEDEVNQRRRDLAKLAGKQADELPKSKKHLQYMSAKPTDAHKTRSQRRTRARTDHRERLTHR